MDGLFDYSIDGNTNKYMISFDHSQYEKIEFLGNETIKDIDDYNSPEINNSDYIIDSMNLEMDDNTNQKTSLKTKRVENESNNEIFKEQIDNIIYHNGNIYNSSNEFPSFISKIKNNFEDINLNQIYYNENNSKKEGNKILSI